MVGAGIGGDMGKYRNLTEHEKRVVLRLGKLKERDDTVTWRSRPIEPGRFPYVGTERPSPPFFTGFNSASSPTGAVEDFPNDRSFWKGLENKGFVAMVELEGNILEINCQQPVSDFFNYNKKSGCGKWREDAAYDLSHELTLRARIVWAVILIIVTLIVTLLITRLYEAITGG